LVSAVAERYEITPACEARWSREAPVAYELLSARVEAGAPDDLRERWWWSVMHTDWDQFIPRDRRGRKRISVSSLLACLAIWGAVMDGAGSAWASQAYVGHYAKRGTRVVRDVKYAAERARAGWFFRRNRPLDRIGEWAPRTNVFIPCVANDLAPPKEASPQPAPRIGPPEAAPVAAVSRPAAPVARAAADPAPSPRPKQRAAAQRRARALITPTHGPEERAIVEELKSHATLEAAGVASPEHAATLWDAAALLGHPVELVKKAVRELVVEVKRGAEEPTLDRLLAFLKCVRPAPTWKTGLAPEAALPALTPQKELAAQERRERASAEEAARYAATAPRRQPATVLPEFEALIPRHARPPPTD
jgi:hypothetical protein